MTEIVCKGQPCGEPCEQGRRCPNRKRGDPPFPMPAPAPLDFGRLNPHGPSGKAIARPFGMGDPIRRPREHIAATGLLLAACFALGVVVGRLA